MNIGLVDVDGHNFPNYALMKLSAWHKSQGDRVEWANPMFGKYDRVYKSKVFTFTPDLAENYNCEIVKGGTGYDPHKQLPAEIDSMQPDYSIYPQINDKTAYGFITRGCTNKCKWCIVPIKEGSVRYPGIMFDYEHGGKIYYAEQPVDPDTVGQFTGLHDRTGKEVYEGDVVFWIAIDMRDRGKGYQGTIIWDNSTMAWAILRDKPTSDGRPCIISRPFDKKHLEVVGNIHDNPELIKGVEYGI